MSDTKEADDFTFGDHLVPKNSKGETFHEAMNRIERERDEAREIAEGYRNSYTPSRCHDPLPWEADTASGK